MSDFTIGADLAVAQMAATIAFADAASGPSVVRFYTTDPPSGSPQVEIPLDKPCATIVGYEAFLNPDPSAVPMVLTDGIPLIAVWSRSDDKLVASGIVSDDLGTAPWKIEGGTTEPGETSPTLQAGGLIILGPLQFF